MGKKVTHAAGIEKTLHSFPLSQLNLIRSFSLLLSHFHFPVSTTTSSRNSISALNISNCSILVQSLTKVKAFHPSLISTMVTVCLVCGGSSKRFIDALVCCQKCQIYAVHRYCMAKVTFEDDVIWFCKYCKPVDALVNADETASASADHSAICNVGPFIVNKEVETTVQSIIEMQPEIDQDCPLSVRMKSLLLQNLAIKLEKVLSCNQENLENQNLKLLDLAIKDAECAKLKMSHLRCWYDQFRKMIDLNQLYKKIVSDLEKKNDLSMANVRKDIWLLREEAALLKQEMGKQEGSMQDLTIKTLSNMEQFCDKELDKACFQ